ncbi:MAG: bifunctional riboflavin kinase/FAD synthetase [Bacteroidales bacterium]|nr:bifunctional riboflavin kinase/FAD synthetase [Bacteroidales bacterium]
MKYYKNLADIPKIDNAIVSIGNFDGVHLGHRAIFDKMKEIKAQTGGEIVVVTFYPHPLNVLYPQKEPLKYINSKGRKNNIFAHYGIDILIEIPFTLDFAKLNAADFIAEILINKIGAKYIVIGYDSHFGGSNHADTYKILEELSDTYHYQLIKIPAITGAGNVISSTKIREFLKCGSIKAANEMLGYEYSIFGQVVYGHQIGRTIGFPTANIFIENELKLIAANGVYACRVKYHGINFFGMCNIGTRPTVNGKDLTIEVNIFDFDEDIYGDYLGVYFVDRLRDEIKFDNLEALKQQLTIDQINAKKLFNV